MNATIIPTHNFRAILSSPTGIKARTKWTPMVGGTEEAAKAKCLQAFPRYTFVSAEIVPAKPVAKKVTLLNKHEYITVSAIYPDGRINLTVSFGGMKASGSAQSLREFLHAADAFIKAKAKGSNYLVAMGELKALAEQSSSTVEFLGKL